MKKHLLAVIIRSKSTKYNKMVFNFQMDADFFQERYGLPFFQFIGFIYRRAVSEP